jgi:hypothetical protein
MASGPSKRMKIYAIYLLFFMYKFALFGQVHGVLHNQHAPGHTPRPHPPNNLDFAAIASIMERVDNPPPSTYRQRKRQRDREQNRQRKQSQRAGFENKSPVSDYELQRRKSEADTCCLRGQCNRKYEPWMIKRLHEHVQSLSRTDKHDWVYNRTKQEKVQVEAGYQADDTDSDDELERSIALPTTPVLHIKIHMYSRQ